MGVGGEGGGKCTGADAPVIVEVDFVGVCVEGADGSGDCEGRRGHGGAEIKRGGIRGTRDIVAPELDDYFWGD